MSAVAERSTDAAPRWPGDGKDFRVTMGLHVCPPEVWLLPAAAAPDLLANKAAVLAAHHDDAFAVMPEGDAAAREAAHVLFTHIATHDPDVGAAVPALLVAEADEQHPLERVGRLIAEDVCIMTPHAVGDAASESAATAAATAEYRLTAALLCAPSRWSLREKLGTSLQSIHGPVPGYGTIAAPTDRFFTRLPVGEIMERTNWSVLDSPTLFQPGFEHARTGVFAHADADLVTGGSVGSVGSDRSAVSDGPAVSDGSVESAGSDGSNGSDGGTSRTSVLQRRWLRLERQTLRKLPQTGAVIFTILTTNTRLDELAARAPETARQLAHKMRTAPEATCVYKGWSDAALVADALEAACLRL